MGVYERLKDKVIALPELARSVAALVPWVQTGKLLFLSENIASNTWRSGRLHRAPSRKEDAQRERGDRTWVCGHYIARRRPRRISSC
jgi:hypothetical protein